MSVRDPRGRIVKGTRCLNILIGASCRGRVVSGRVESGRVESGQIDVVWFNSITGTLGKQTIDLCTYGFVKSIIKA